MNALVNNQLDFFFENNFNEASHSINEAFLIDVKKLAIAIHTNMKGVATKGPWQQYLPQKEAVTEINILSNTLFSCLRLIQFLNANDHE